MEQLNCAGTMIGMSDVKKLRCIGGGNLLVVLQDGRKYVGHAGEELKETQEDLDPLDKVGRRAYVLTQEGPKEVAGQVPNKTELGNGGNLKMATPDANK